MGYELSSSAHFAPAPPSFVGGRQPFGPPAPLLAGLSIDNIVWDRRNSQQVQLEAIQAQPETWVYDFMGAGQPYGPRKISPQLTIPAVNQPSPATRPQIEAQFYLGAQPDPWAYAFEGGQSPYAPAKTTRQIPASPFHHPPSIGVGCSTMPSCRSLISPTRGPTNSRAPRSLMRRGFPVAARTR